MLKWDCQPNGCGEVFVLTHAANARRHQANSCGSTCFTCKESCPIEVCVQSCQAASGSGDPERAHKFLNRISESGHAVILPSLEFMGVRWSLERIRRI